YIGLRTLQYYGVEHDAGLYVPIGANVVFRARGLEGHLQRIKAAPAWRALDRRVLHDAVLRRQFNDLLKTSGMPTLDDLEDERKPFARNQARLIDVIGDDLIATLQVKDAIPKAPFCAIVRLRWLYYLATPFAGLFLPTETIDGQTCLVLRQGPQEIRVALVGSLAIASSDKGLLSQALRRQGKEEESPRPMAGRVVFEGSSGLLAVRQALQASGVLPYVSWPTARGLTISGDLSESMLRLDAQLDRALPLHSTPPPYDLRTWTPGSATGLLLTNTGGADLMAWLRSLVVGSGPKDFAASTVHQALQALDDGGLQSNLLPQLQNGMAFVTGVEEHGGRSYTTFALLLPTRDPAAAVEALNGMVRKIAGGFGDSKYFSSFKVGDVTLNSWSWPDGLQINDLLSPTYGAVKDILVIGNNAAFTTQVVQTAAEGGGFEETSEFRKLRTRLKEEGFGADPSLACGYLLPPLVRASLDGSLHHASKQLIYQTLNGPALRAEVEGELRRRGTPTEADIVRAYNEAIDRKIDEQESALRRNLEPLNAVRWAALEALEGEKGIRFHAALELR
ncbi:MAG TPA: hypothetical protein VKU80_13930, partial [Planctomycetota bacterium]|nr:hypothetical protein [Planctomycetota bacterium]